MAKNRIEELTSRPLRTAEDARTELSEPADVAPWEGKATPAEIAKSLEGKFSDNATVCSPPIVDVPVVPTLSTKNRTKLDRVKLHIERLFTLAASGLIDGEHFYGKTSIEIAWIDGVAQEIRPAISACDRIGN